MSKHAYISCITCILSPPALSLSVLIAEFDCLKLLKNKSLNNAEQEPCLLALPGLLRFGQRGNWIRACRE